MGTIIKRVTKDGEIRYHAKIRIRKQGQDEYTESQTFSKNAVAEAWIKKRETELKENFKSAKKNASNDMTLGEAITKYLSEVSGFGRSKASTMRLISRLPIARKRLSTLDRQDFAEYVTARRNGDLQDYGLEACAPSTVNMDLQYIRTILTHAELVWNLDVNIHELEKASKGLRSARLIANSEERDRLPTSAELQKLTTASFIKFNFSGYPVTPIYLILWLAIYTSRRLSELTRLDLNNYDPENHRWRLSSVKNPKGSAGNDRWFKVDERAEKVIAELMRPEMRARMLRGKRNPNMLVPCTREAIDREWQDIKEKAGIVDLHFHDLRHEAATRLAEKGLSIPQLQQYTLHRDWNSLKRYVNLDTVRKTVLDFDEAMLAAKNSKIDDYLN